MATGDRIGFVLIGDREIVRKLDMMSRTHRNRVVRPAVSAAVVPVVKAAKSNLSNLRYSGTGPKAAGKNRLKKAIKKRVKTYAGVVVAIVGPKSRVAPHAHLVHDGTKPHDIPLPAGGYTGRYLQWLGVATTVRHPGAKPNPFLLNALKQTRIPQATILSRELRLRFEKLAREINV